jgi:hypothetical protein
MRARARDGRRTFEALNFSATPRVAKRLWGQSQASGWRLVTFPRLSTQKVSRSRHGFGLATMVIRADVAELVDAHGSGPCGRKLVEVQVLSSA